MLQEADKVGRRGKPPLSSPLVMPLVSTLPSQSNLLSAPVHNIITLSIKYEDMNVYSNLISDYSPPHLVKMLDKHWSGALRICLWHQ